MGIQFYTISDSDSDTDTESMNHYSIHDSRYPRQRPSTRPKQSKMCLSLTIGRGRLTAFVDSKVWHFRLLFSCLFAFRKKQK